MASFDGKTFTYTRENAAERDKALPDLGGLSKADIVAKKGFAGLSGVETALIHDDRMEYLQGNDFIERDKKLTDITHQDVRLLCKQNHDEQILQNSTLQVGQDRWKTTKGDTIEHYTGGVSIVYISKKEVEEPAELIHHVEERLSYGSYHMDAFGAYSLAAVAANSSFIGNVDLRGYNLGLLIASNEFKAIEAEEKEESVSVVMMRQSIRITEAFAIGVEPGVGAAMFHEVAITQEIIAVGANQAL